MKLNSVRVADGKIKKKTLQMAEGREKQTLLRLDLGTKCGSFGFESGFGTQKSKYRNFKKRSTTR